MIENIIYEPGSIAAGARIVLNLSDEKYKHVFEPNFIAITNTATNRFKIRLQPSGKEFVVPPVWFLNIGEPGAVHTIEIQELEGTQNDDYLQITLIKEAQA